MERKSTSFVDSTLLRFLSFQNKLQILPSDRRSHQQQQLQLQQQLLRQKQQKREQQQQQRIKKQQQQPSDFTLSKIQQSATTFQSDENYQDVVDILDDYNIISGEDLESITQSTSESALAYQVVPIPNFMDYITAFRHDSWLFEYSSQKVTNILLSRSATATGEEALEATIAKEAGDNVQLIALSRASRRRIRTFVRDRERGTVTLSSRPEAFIQDQDIDTEMTDLNSYENSMSSSFATASAGESQSSNIVGVVDLLTEYGLTIKDIAEIFIHSPGIAFMRPKPIPNVYSGGETLQETMDRVFTGLLMGPTLNLRKYDARKIVRNTPGLLTMKGSKCATDIVGLLGQLGVSANSIARSQNSLPKLLSRSPQAVFRLVAFLASDAIRMPMANIGPLLRRNECLELLDAVAPVPWTEKKGYFPNSPKRSFQFHVKSKLEQILHDEQINEIYQKMSLTAWTLRNKIGTVDLGKVISAYPSVLLLDAENQILPAAAYLMEDLGIWEDDLPRVLQLYPALLGKDISEMKTIVDYLISLEVSPDHFSSIFRSFPSLLTMSVDNDIGPVVKFLRDHIGISNVGRFITRLPPVLGYSVDNELRPKWEYLESITADPRFDVSKFPAVFSYPLTRIQARFEYLKNVKKVPTQLLSLDQVLCYGDRDFSLKVARDKDNGASYMQFLEDRKNEVSRRGKKQLQQQSNKQNNKYITFERQTFGNLSVNATSTNM